jgi:hypothetical protein
MLDNLQMNSMPTRISYTVSAVEMVRLLLWNTSKVADIPGFHTAKHMKQYTEF